MKHLGNLVAIVILLINLLVVGGLTWAAYSPYIDPSHHPIQASMGLTFPIFLLLNICFFIFWLTIQRYKSALLPLFGFLLCYQQIATYFPINLHAEEVPQEHIKLLSYNIMGFGDAKKGNNQHPILTYLYESNADILCLQEYNTSSNGNIPSQKEVEQTLKAYKYKHIQTVGNKGSKRSRVACFSKYPILSAKTIKSAGEYNGAVAYQLKIGKDTLLLINCHLESNKLKKADKEIYEEMIAAPEQEKMKNGSRQLLDKLGKAVAIRASQAEAIRKEITTTRHPFVIVCGDFNDTPISYTHRIIKEGMNDAYSESGNGAGISYNKNKFFFRIDHILTTPNLKTYNCRVDRSIKNSDHFPISCQITKRK